MTTSWPPRRWRRYADRAEAGRALADALAGEPADVVAALPRGGVPVGAPIAVRLGVPLRVFLARKVGAPGHEELAIGAMAAGGEPFLDRTLMARLGLAADAVAHAIERTRRRLEEQAAEYGEFTLLATAAAGLRVVLVDDGLATGATMIAAARALTVAGVGRLTVAVPVGSDEAVRLMAAECDSVVCLQTPAHFRAVGEWYADFGQVETEQVLETLRSAKSSSDR